MDTFRDNIEDLVGHIGQYADARKDMMLLNLAEKSSDGLSKAIVWSVAIVLGAVALFFLSVAAAIWAGERLGSMPDGFAAVGGFYALVLLLFLFFGKRAIESAIGDNILKMTEKIIDND